MDKHSASSPAKSRELSQFIERIAATPPNATVKGMYIDAFLQTLNRKGFERPSKKRFMSFTDYPLSDYMSLLLEACPKLHPKESLAEALRLQGRLVYPTLVTSTIGKVIFSIAGRSWAAALPLAARGYEISLKPGSATLQEQSEKGAVVALRDVHNFAECFHVGVMEGAMEIFRVDGTVTPQKQDRLCDVDLVLKWS